MLRIIFMGTPDFAVPTLSALLDAGHEVVGVYSQPPRAAGRGLAARKSPVQLFAEGRNLSVFTPPSLKLPHEQARFKGLDADAAVVVAYGLILPKPVLEAPRFDCFNIHASLLPHWRGAAPIQRAIMAGDAETGVSIMRIEQGLDAGPVCLVERIPIGREETAGDLHDRLAELGARLMVRALAELERGTLACHPQHDEAATYAPKIDPKETHINWRLLAADVHDRIRGLAPAPGAWFEVEINGRPERIKVLRSTLAQGSGRPGELLDDRLTVACGEGAVRLTEVQRAGKRAMSAEDLLRGVQLRAGTVLK
jgi:methionyl-tRNA formyltransferase